MAWTKLLRILKKLLEAEIKINKKNKKSWIESCHSRYKKNKSTGKNCYK